MHSCFACVLRSLETSRHAHGRCFGQVLTRWRPRTRSGSGCERQRRCRLPNGRRDSWCPEHRRTLPDRTHRRRRFGPATAHQTCLLSTTHMLLHRHPHQITTNRRPPPRLPMAWRGIGARSAWTDPITECTRAETPCQSELQASVQVGCKAPTVRLCVARTSETTPAFLRGAQDTAADPWCYEYPPHELLTN